MYLWTIFYSWAGTVWKSVRKVLNPMFNLTIVHSFISIFNEKSQIFVQELSQEVGRPAFDFLSYAGVSTLDAICGKNLRMALFTGYGEKLNLIKKKE